MADDMPFVSHAVKAFAHLLIERGVDRSIILDALLALPEALLVTPRNANAARQARFRARQALRRNVTLTPLARVEDSSSKIQNPEKKEKKKAPDVTALRAELETVLDPEHAKAVVEYRQASKSPMKTLQTAKALAGKFAKCPDPNGAADTMLARGWIGIEPGWLTDGKTAPASGEVLYKFSTADEVLADLERQRKNHV